MVVSGSGEDGSRCSLEKEGATLHDPMACPTLEGLDYGKIGGRDEKCIQEFRVYLGSFGELSLQRSSSMCLLTTDQNVTPLPILIARIAGGPGGGGHTCRAQKGNCPDGGGHYRHSWTTVDTPLVNCFGCLYL